MKYLARLTLILALSASPTAFGHGPAPSPLEALNLVGQTSGGFVPDPSDPTAYADTIRTSIGLVFSLPDATYRFSCPSMWGSTNSFLAASTPDRSLVVVTALGLAAASTDEGCSFSELPTQGWFSASVYSASGRIWLLARTQASDGTLGESALLEVLPDATLREHHRWPDNFLPDDLAEWRSPDGTARGLLVMGARPSLALWLATFDTDSADSALSWSALAEDLPPAADLQDLSRISLRAITDDGTLWLQTTFGTARRLWLASPHLPSPHEGDLPDPSAFAGGLPLQWVTTQPSQPDVDVILGPVWMEGQWWAVFGGKLSWFPAIPSAPPALPTEQAVWTLGQAVDWTCLRARQDAVHACALFRLMHVTDMGDATASPVVPPTANIIFTFDNLGPPLRGCPSPDPNTVAACESDWFHYGGESGFVNRDPIDLYGDVVTVPKLDDPDASDASDTPQQNADTSTINPTDPTDDTASTPSEPSDDCACTSVHTPSPAPHPGAWRFVIYAAACAWLIRRKFPTGVPPQNASP